MEYRRAFLVEWRSGRRLQHVPRSGYGQALTALGATSLEHRAAILGTHSHQEAMGAPTATAIRLVRTLHVTPGRVVQHPGET